MGKRKGVSGIQSVVVKIDKLGGLPEFRREIHNLFLKIQ
jgi:hypothetical protein